MNCRRVFLTSLACAIAAAIFFRVGIGLYERYSTPTPPPPDSPFIYGLPPRPGIAKDDLAPANAVFLPFGESASEDVAFPVIPGGRRLEISMLAGWYGGRCDGGTIEGGKQRGGHFYGLWIEGDGRWLCSSVELHGCFPEYRTSRGHVTVVNGGLVFNADTLEGWPSPQMCDVTPVWWGERIYLLGPGDIARFCDAVNWGNEPRREVWGDSSAPYVRSKACGYPVQGPVESPVGDALPLLPARFAAWILGAPVEARLSLQLPDGSWVADFGSRSGAFEGMTLRDKTGSVDLRVERAGTDASIVRAVTMPESRLSVGTTIWSDAKGATLIK